MREKPQTGSVVKAQESPGRRVVILGTVLVGLCTIGSISYLQDRADRGRRVQIAIARVEARAHEIEALEWQAMARHQVSPEIVAEFDEARNGLLQTLDKLLEDQPSDHSLDKFAILCRGYLEAVSRELELIKRAHLEQAKEVDLREVDPLFDVLSREIDQLDANHAQAVQAASRESKMGLMAATLFSTSLVVFLFRRFQRAKYHAGLIAAEQAALKKDELRFRTLTEKSGEIIAIISVEGMIRYVSPSVKNIVGMEDATLWERDLLDLVHPEDKETIRAELAGARAEQESDRIQFRLRHSDGGWLQVECLIRNLLNDENIGGLVLNVRDVTARRRAEEELLFCASHDGLTKLPNRLLFLQQLRVAIGRVRRYPEQIAAVLFIDVDDFKVINDSLGHEAGDKLIKELSGRLKTCLRSGDTISRSDHDGEMEESEQIVARLGGDEFTILLEDVREPSDAIRVAQRIQSALQQPFDLGSHKVQRTASIGISLVSGQSSAEDLLRNADIAMYRAKLAGKARCELFDQDMHAQVVKRLQLENDLRRAEERHEFRLYYQPIVSLPTLEVAGFEALLRWQRPGEGVVAPGEFIAAMENTGMMISVGRWILCEACRQAAAWNRTSSARPPLYVSVNVSGRQLYHSGFLQHVQEALQGSGLPPQHLKLELTEGVAMENAPKTEQILRQIKALGVQLSIDDFGTGYSSLSYLRRFPVDTLKIDRSFIAQMHTDKEARTIVTTIVALARSLSLEVVAEGLELPEQLEQLKKMMCDSAQGYLISRPLPAEDAADFVRSARARMAGQGG